MHTPLAPFEYMARISTRMVDAARNGEWDELVKLEQDMAAIRDSLIADDRNGRTPTTPLSETEQQYKANLIRQMLDNQEAVVAHVRPWMEEARDLLGNQTRNRSVNKAYGQNLQPR